MSAVFSRKFLEFRLKLITNKNVESFDPFVFIDCENNKWKIVKQCKHKMKKLFFKNTTMMVPDLENKETFFQIYKNETVYLSSSELNAFENKHITLIFE